MEAGNEVKQHSNGMAGNSSRIFFQYSSVQFDEDQARCIHGDILKLVKKDKNSR
jgi:hypothetical protein